MLLVLILGTQLNDGKNLQSTGLTTMRMKIILFLKLWKSKIIFLCQRRINWLCPTISNSQNMISKKMIRACFEDMVQSMNSSIKEAISRKYNKGIKQEKILKSL